MTTKNTKKRVFITVSIALTLFISACNPCRRVECPLIPFFDIEFADKQNSAIDLFESGRLTLDSVQITSILHNPNGLKMESDLIEGQGGAKPLIRFFVNSNLKAVVIRAASFPADTFEFFGRPIDSECCGSLLVLDSVTINNKPHDQFAFESVILLK